MKALIKFILFLIPLIPIVLAALLPMLSNLKKKDRYLQLFLPVVALIYGIVYLIFMDELSVFLLDKLFLLLDFLEKHVGNIPLLGKIVDFFRGINWTYGIMYLSNLVMLILFVILKTALLPILKVSGHPQKNPISGFLTKLFYKYDEKENKWYIKDGLAQAQKVMLGCHIGIIAFSLLLFSVTCYLISRNLLSVPFYPVFGILVYGECYFFLSGEPKVPKKEDDPESAPEDEEEEEIDYSVFKELYEKLFGDRLSGTAELSPSSDKRSAVDQLLERYYREYEETNSQEALLFYRFFKDLSENEEYTLDDGLISAARCIIDGKNVLFTTPFYRDTTAYIFLPVMRHLMRNRKLLIVVGRTGAEESIVSWLKQGLFKVNNFEDLWRISYLSDATDETNIAVLPMKDIYNQSIISAKEKFLEETSLVMVMDPTRLLGTMQLGMSNLVGYIRRGITPQYIAYDRNCDGLVDSLSHVLNSSFEEVAATVSGNAQTTAMVWEADGVNLHSRIGLDIARYLGMGTELGAVALSGKVSGVDWYAYENFPATDIRWIVSQYYSPLCKLIDSPVSQAELEKRLRISADIWSMAKKKDCFIVAEDEYYNSYEIIRQFSSRASKQAFIHVLSPNYLLRDYMCANADIFTNDPKAIPSLVADYQRVRSNAVYRITMRLINDEISEEEIRSVFELVGIEDGDIYEILTALITDYFIPESSDIKLSADGVINVRYELIIDPETRRPERKRMYSISNTVFIEKFLSQLQVVHYIAEDEQNRDLYMNSILYGHIYQKFLPGTFVVFDGKYYEVVSITAHSGMIVRRAADHLTRRRYQRQLRTYTIDGFKNSNEISSTVTFGKIRIEHGQAAIKVATEGYLDLTDYGDINHATRVTLSGIPERSYPKKNILRFKMEGADARVRFTVATMMNELFVTLFPEMKEYIVATTAHSYGRDGDGYIPSLVLKNGQDDDYIYVIEDSLIDMGLLINVERYFKRILEIIADQLYWHFDQIDEEAASDPGSDDGAGYDDDGDDGSEGADGENGKKKKSWWRRFIDWIKRLFGRKKKKKKGSDEGGTDDDSDFGSEGGTDDGSDFGTESGSDDGSDGSSDNNGDNTNDGDAPVIPPEIESDDEAGDEGTDTTDSNADPEAESGKKKGFFGWVKGIFSRKKKKKKDPSEDFGTDDFESANSEDNTDISESKEAVPAGAVSGENNGADTMKTSFNFNFKNSDMLFDVVDDNADDVTGEDEESADVDTENPGIARPSGKDSTERKPYSKRYYMLYGYEELKEMFDLEGTLGFLAECGFDYGYLTQARQNAKDGKRRWYNTRFEPGEHYCDFCGTKLKGKISVMKDGRERCQECTATAITKVRDFKKLYKNVHRRMEDVFGIKIKTKIKIRITNAEEIARECGYTFNPTPGVDSRALGFAQRMGNGTTRLVLENGAPKLETEKTLVHELTHVWQYENMGCLWEPKRDLVAIEGMAVWSEAQYLMCIGLEERADAYVQSRIGEQSEYGQGMREYIRKFPLRSSRTAKKGTPFTYIGKNPLN